MNAMPVLQAATLAGALAVLAWPLERAAAAGSAVVATT